jgi:hypothetical protein
MADPNWSDLGAYINIGFMDVHTFLGPSHGKESRKSGRRATADAENASRAA